MFETKDGRALTLCSMDQVPGTGSELKVCVGEEFVAVDGGAVYAVGNMSDPFKVLMIQTTQPASPSNNYIEVFHLHSDLFDLVPLSTWRSGSGEVPVPTSPTASAFLG